VLAERFTGERFHFFQHAKDYNVASSPRLSMIRLLRIWQRTKPACQWIDSGAGRYLSIDYGDTNGCDPASSASEAKALATSRMKLSCIEPGG
jgi:hypothetical protein